MSDKPETLSAILADMRNPPHKWEGFSRADLARLADRIEAAAERERDEDRQLAAIAESDEAFARCARCDRPERAPGNAAMREALADLVENIEIRAKAFDIFSIVDKKTWLDAKAALAAPARNCDRFATEDEAREAYWAYREPLEFNNKPFVAITEWLFDKAEGGAE